MLKIFGLFKKHTIFCSTAKSGVIMTIGGICMRYLLMLTWAVFHVALTSKKENRIDKAKTHIAVESYRIRVVVRAQMNITHSTAVTLKYWTRAETGFQAAVKVELIAEATHIYTRHLSILSILAAVQRWAQNSRWCMPQTVAEWLLL